MARRDRPDATPLVVRHRRDWRRWWRYCRCGLCWRCCPDRGRSVLVHLVLRRPDAPPQLASVGGPPPRPLPRNHNSRFGLNAPTLIDAETGYGSGQRRRGRRAELSGR
ncbi:hypothetical protein [Plantactinospora mayteni]|nr:hypothetical protein [Plantactinospora mayteni]